MKIAKRVFWVLCYFYMLRWIGACFGGDVFGPLFALALPRRLKDSRMVRRTRSPESGSAWPCPLRIVFSNACFQYFSWIRHSYVCEVIIALHLLSHLGHKPVYGTGIYLKCVIGISLMQLLCCFVFLAAALLSHWTGLCTAAAWLAGMTYPTHHTLKPAA